MIEAFLKEKGKLFYKQYTFEDCRHQKPLPFDFYVVGHGDSRDILIEFDGEQHFRPIEFFGGEEFYRKQKERDVIKEQFCLERNFKLVRIPYYEIDNIAQILEQEVS